MPDLAHSPWQLIKSITLGSFVYTFYHLTTMPGIFVAATTTKGINPITGADALRVTWRMGNTIWTVSNEENLVCEKSIYGVDNKKYTLEEYLQRIERAAQK